MCQGFSHFSGFLHHFLLATLVTSCIWVKDGVLSVSIKGESEQSSLCICLKTTALKVQQFLGMVILWCKFNNSILA